MFSSQVKAVCPFASFLVMCFTQRTEESSTLVLSLLKREGDGGDAQSLSERVRRLSERALQKGLECSSTTQMAEPSTAEKKMHSPTYRW